MSPWFLGWQGSKSGSSFSSLGSAETSSGVMDVVEMVVAEANEVDEDRGVSRIVVAVDFVVDGDGVLKIEVENNY